MFESFLFVGVSSSLRALAYLFAEYLFSLHASPLPEGSRSTAATAAVLYSALTQDCLLFSLLLRPAFELTCPAPESRTRGSSRGWGPRLRLQSGAEQSRAEQRL